MNTNYVKPLRWLVGHTRHSRSYANQLLCTPWRHLGRARTAQQGGCVPVVVWFCCSRYVRVCVSNERGRYQSRNPASTICSGSSHKPPHLLASTLKSPVQSKNQNYSKQAAVVAHPRECGGDCVVVVGTGRKSPFFREGPLMSLTSLMSIETG